MLYCVRIFKFIIIKLIFRDDAKQLPSHLLEGKALHFPKTIRCLEMAGVSGKGQKKRICPRKCKSQNQPPPLPHNPAHPVINTLPYQPYQASICIFLGFTPNQQFGIGAPTSHWNYLPGFGTMMGQMEQPQRPIGNPAHSKPDSGLSQSQNPDNPQGAVCQRVKLLLTWT